MTAEFLIYNKDHWMDSLTQKQIDDHIVKDPQFQRKYDARFRKGDVVEIRKDGVGMVGLEPESFALIKTSMSFEAAQMFQKGIMENGVTTLRRRYKIETKDISFDINKEATLNDIEINNVLEAKV